MAIVSEYRANCTYTFFVMRFDVHERRLININAHRFKRAPKYGYANFEMN